MLCCLTKTLAELVSFLFREHISSAVSTELSKLKSTPQLETLRNATEMRDRCHVMMPF